MIDRRKLIASSAAAVLAPAIIGRAQAQTWPNRFVRLVVPFPPGGGTDAIARVMSAKLSDMWGHQLVVENRGGAATNIGTEAVARAEPDGYAMLLQSMPLAVNKFLFATLPYDPIADLAPVSLLCDYPNIMVVPNSLAGAFGHRVHRPCQGQQGQDHLCLVRARHLGASLR